MHIAKHGPPLSFGGIFADHMGTAPILVVAPSHVGGVLVMRAQKAKMHPRPAVNGTSPTSFIRHYMHGMYNEMTRIVPLPDGQMMELLLPATTSWTNYV